MLQYSYDNIILTNDIMLNSCLLHIHQVALLQFYL